ncbi:MAG: CaiB/BaiF CoA transferase family protein [Pseudomonadales bacterium]
MTSPLNGIRVLDLTQIYQGPYATFLMAQAGAQVIKIEPPEGERLRPHPKAKPSLAFATLNSNKLSVSANLKTEQGKGLFLELVRSADMVVENYGPGAMERLGLGWKRLQAENDQLIYVSGTGFGLSGPDHDLLAMDHTIQAASGLMGATGGPEDPPTRAGGAPSDFMGGIHMYAGAVTALLGRNQTGHGTHVEVSMLEAMYFNLTTELAALFATGSNPDKHRHRSPSTVVPYSVFRCRDGRYVAVICIMERHWQTLAQVMGQPELADDARFSRKTRFDNEAQLNALIEAWTATLDQEQVFTELREAKIPVAPVRTIEDVYGNTHMLARGSLQSMEHPEAGPMMLPGSPIRYSEFDAPELAFFPELGSANRIIYGDLLGYGEDQLAALLASGAI